MSLFAHIVWSTLRDIKGKHGSSPDEDERCRYPTRTPRLCSVCLLAKPRDCWLHDWTLARLLEVLAYHNSKIQWDVRFGMLLIRILSPSGTSRFCRFEWDIHTYIHAQEPQTYIHACLGLSDIHTYMLRALKHTYIHVSSLAGLQEVPPLTIQKKMN